MIRQQIDSMIWYKLGEDNQYKIYNNIYIKYSIKNQKKLKNFLLLKKRGDKGDNPIKCLAANGFVVPLFARNVPPAPLFWAKTRAANKWVQKEISELNFVPP